MKRLFSFLAIYALFFPIHQSLAQGELWGTTRIGGAGNNGTIFKINCDNNAHTVMYSFPADGTKGTFPHGSLVMHSNGMLYGLTRNGGSNGLGVLFEFNPTSNVYTKKLDLSETTGHNSFGSMIEANGKLYGTTSNGGSWDYGVFFEYNPANNQSIVVLSFDTPNGTNAMGTPMIASNGKMYGLTPNGGTNGMGVLFEFNITTRVVTRKINFTNAGPQGQSPWLGAGPYGTLIEAAPGKLYGVTGGNSTNASLFEYDIATNVITPKYNFPTNGSNGSLFKEGLELSANGKLYGLASIGGLNNHGTIYEYDLSTGVFTKKIDLSSEGLANPRGSFVDMPNGKMYGTVSTTPTGGAGAWFEYDPATNSITNKVFFQGSDGSNPEFVKLLYPSPTIAFATIPTKNYGAAPFTLTATATAGPDIVFTSADQTVASISGQTVTVHKPGTTVITATANYLSTCSYRAPKPVQQILTVNKAPLTVTAEPKTKIYGQPNPTLTFTYSGFVNNETSIVLDTQPKITTAAMPMSNVGNYAITLSEGSDDNYSYVFANATLSINKAALTITADNKSKIYGDANPELTITYTGFIGNETSLVLDTKPVIATTATTSSNAGPYAITISGAVDINYTITHVPGTLNVQKKVVTVKADNKTRPYGSDNPNLTFSYSGFLANENEYDLDQLPSINTSALKTSNAGQYSITLTAGNDVSYSLAFQNAILTITKVPLTVQADNVSRTYGSQNPALTLSLSGFVGGDDIDDIDVLPTAATTAAQSTHAGQYDITVSGGSDNNYSLVYKTGKFRITKTYVAVKPDNKSRTYGATDPSFSVTYEGLMNDETSDVLDNLPAVVSAATTASHPGDYKLTVVGASDNDYDFLYLDGTLIIKKGTLTVTADDVSRPYGQSNPAFSMSLLGFVNGDVKEGIDRLPVAFTSADSHSPVDDYEVSPSGGSDIDYNFIYEPGILSVLKADQEVSLEAITNRALGETPFSLVANADSGLPIAFTSESSKIKIENNKITMLASGRATVKASQVGNENYFEAAFVERSFCINPPKPVIDITNAISIAPVLTSSSSFGNQWYLNNGLIDGATGQTFTSSLSGVYTVQVTSDDCVSLMSDKAGIVITGDIAEQPRLAHYPNPVDDILYVEGVNSESSFSIADMTGRLQDVSSMAANEKHAINVQHLSAGVYILHVQSTEFRSYFKFVKK